MKSKKTEIIVSICCITYNQAMYIRQAIDGFLMQKTNFVIEILIHDDASTDGTTSIIKEYVEKYPEIIKPIYQTENQYSQGKEIFSEWLFPRAQGKYIALCEGDDYWTDPLKLQKQVDLMKKYPDILLCFNPSFYVINKQEIIPKRDIFFYPKYKTIINNETIIMGDGNYITTPSILVHKTAIDKYCSYNIKFVVGDFFIQIISSHPNGALFIPEYMSCYRINSIGSWSSSQSKKTLINLVDFINILHNQIKEVILDLGVKNQEKALKYLYKNQICSILRKSNTNTNLITNINEKLIYNCDYLLILARLGKLGKILLTGVLILRKIFLGLSSKIKFKIL